MEMFGIFCAFWGFLHVSAVLNSASEKGTKLTSCEDAWVPFQGSCYFFGYEKGMTYTDATHFCQVHHSELVQVDDVHENNFLKDFMRRLKSHNYWLGLNDDVIEGEWRWSTTNETPTFTDWYPGQPESGNHQLNEDCADFLSGGADFKWGDHECSNLFQPLCEKKFEDYELVGK